MMIEAVDLVLDEDSKAGLDPFDRTAPQEPWAEFAEHMRHADLTSMDELVRKADAGNLSWMATQLAIRTLFENERKPTVHKVAQAAVQHASAAA
jgi:hypothetical protein